MSNEPTIAQMKYTIAKFMSYEKVTVAYADSEEETEWQRNHEEWMSKVGIQFVGDYIVDVPNNKWHKWEDVKYHTSWDWLMPVWVKWRRDAPISKEAEKWTDSLGYYLLTSDEPKRFCERLYYAIQWLNQQKQTNGNPVAKDKD